MRYSIVTNNTKVKNVVSELLSKYPTLHSDKKIEKTALSDLYIIDNNKMLFKKDRFYIIICRKECLDITFEEMNNELKKLLLKEKDDEK